MHCITHQILNKKDIRKIGFGNMKMSFQVTLFKFNGKFEFS